ncbi:MAG: CAP domain-containing protein [Solirubrobacteraceae bacterium]
MSCALGTGSAAAGSGGCARASAIADKSTRRQAVSAVLCVVNGERMARGLSPVHGSRALTRSARAQSRDMVRRRYFAHDRPGGRTLRQRVVRSGYLYRRPAGKVGETIVWGTRGFATPAQLVSSLLQSPGHRAILLDPSYRHIGIGLVLAAPVAAVLPNSATLTLVLGHR